MSVPMNLETERSEAKSVVQGGRIGSEGHSPSALQRPGRLAESRSSGEGLSNGGISNGLGLSIDRRFTASLAGRDPLDTVRYERRRSVISNPDGSVVFKMDDAEIPEGWSQLATDIVVSKYFRKTEVPNGQGGFGPETSVKQVVRRIALAIRQSGEKLGHYFATPESAQVFQDELEYMLVHQMARSTRPRGSTAV